MQTRPEYSTTSEAEAVEALLKRLTPDQIIHLAARLEEMEMEGFGAVKIIVKGGKARFINREYSEGFGLIDT